MLTALKKTFGSINIVGGGSQDTTLNRMTASACGVPVYAGPTEATVLGNVSVQFMALGELKNVADARRAIAASFAPQTFVPQDTAVWQNAYERYKNIIHGI